MKYELKLSGLTLAQQSRILKKLEKNKNPNISKGIHYTRVHVLRKEARSTHIALGFLRGRSLSEMEKPYRPADKGHITSKNMTRTIPNWTRIEELVVKHGAAYFENDQQLQQEFAEFKETGSVGVVN